MQRQRESSKHGLDRFGNMDTPGIEPGASRMLSGCDTTTPCALLAQLDLVDFLVHLLAFHLMIRNKQYRQRFATSCSAEFFTCFSRSLSIYIPLSTIALSLPLSLHMCMFSHANTSHVPCCFRNIKKSRASLAQLAEHPLSKREVVGSNPTGGCFGLSPARLPSF